MKEDAFYRQLVQRYQNNQATDEELQLFFQLLNEGKLDPYLTEAMDAMAGGEKAPAAPAKLRRIFPWRVAAAAVIVMLMAGAAYIWFNSKTKQPAVVVQQTSHDTMDIAPGGNKAVLTLADGKKIVLDNAQNGVETQQGSTTINKNGAQLTYDATRSQLNTDNSQLTNTISTPRGGQYQVVLPDGSKVWMNAASSIRFPTAFTGNERRVELTGEAYFEIAKDKSKPFLVDVNGLSTVEVLGTHFNIMAYEDENHIETTLLEGSVKVVNRSGAQPGSIGNRGSALLKPGQQAAIHNAELTIHDNADLDEVMAWRNGHFRFNNTNITTIMRQAARWYDVDIIYQGNVMDESFSGNVPRSENISSLLKILELTKTIRCTIKDRKILIQPYSTGN